jgi:zinc transport system ATP-binding protein
MENLNYSNNKCSDVCCTKVENLSVTIGTNKILKDINLHFHCGELTSIIGPNGAGKSTLLKALLGELKHTGKLTYVSTSSKNISTPIKHIFLINPSILYKLLVLSKILIHK